MSTHAEDLNKQLAIKDLIFEDMYKKLVTLNLALEASNEVIKCCKIVMKDNDPTNYKLIFGE